jgi:hypothetical protein
MMETVLSALHSVSKKEGPVNLEIGVAEGKIGLFVRSSGDASALVESQFYAQYPDAEIEPVPAHILDPTPGELVLTQELVLADPELYPIKRHPQYVDQATRQTIDTIAGILGTRALSQTGHAGARADCVRTGAWRSVPQACAQVLATPQEGILQAVGVVRQHLHCGAHGPGMVAACPVADRHAHGRVPHVVH